MRRKQRLLALPRGVERGLRIGILGICGSVLTACSASTSHEPSEPAVQAGSPRRGSEAGSSQGVGARGNSDLGEPCAAKEQPAAPRTDAPTDGMGLVPGGRVQLGASEADLRKLVEVSQADGLRWSRADLGSATPTRQVVLAAYYLDLYPVSVKAYARCVDAGACTEPNMADCSDPEFATWGKPKYAEHPVNCVSWKQAMTYCDSRGARLPTLDEWEFAARGPEGRLFPWGDTPASQLQSRVGNFADRSFAASPESAGLFPVVSYDDGYARTSPVGAFPAGASPFGHLDMAGGIGEMTNSPNFSERQCARRGGSWGQPPVAAASVFEDFYNPDYGSPHTAFRCARTAAAAAK